MSSTKKLSVSDAILAFDELFTAAFHRRLRELLEGRHLYQGVSIEVSDIKATVKSRLINPAGDSAGYDVGVAYRLARFVVDVRPSSGPAEDGPAARNETIILFSRLSNLKLYCHQCKEREAFAPIWTADPTFESHGEAVKRALNVGRPAQRSVSGFPVQFLILLYQCQICHSDPAVFLVRVNRKSWTLSIHGRSPMENVEVPAYIPKEEQRFYRDALIAQQTGKILAGVFYLRTFLEQFARRQTGLVGRSTGEEIMAAYNVTLPPTLVGQMPSLREWYDKLSAAVHEAREDDAVFDEAMGQINQHFDIRRVHRLPDKPAEQK